MDLFDSSSSSSEDEIDRRKVPRIENYIETIVANCNNKEFQQHFRVTRIQFQQILLKVMGSLERLDGSVGRLRVSAEKQLMAVLWLLATPDSYR